MDSENPTSFFGRCSFPLATNYNVQAWIDWSDQGDDWETQPECQETPADDWSNSDQTETKMTF